MFPFVVFFYHWGMFCLQKICPNRMVALGCTLLFISSPACAEGKSLWQGFVDFFSPTSEVEGDGPLYDELRELDRKLNRVEGKYARERRPMHKSRYKKELDELKQERENLVKRIEDEKAGQASSSSVKSASSVARGAGSSSIDGRSSVASSSSSVAGPSSSEIAESSSAKQDSSATPVAMIAQMKEMLCRPDTVYVRDTVVVHDTLFVMLAPKPESAVPADTSKK